MLRNQNKHLIYPVAATSPNMPNNDTTSFEEDYWDRSTSLLTEKLIVYRFATALRCLAKRYVQRRNN